MEPLVVAVACARAHLCCILWVRFARSTCLLLAVQRAICARVNLTRSLAHLVAMLSEAQSSGLARSALLCSALDR